MPHFSKGTHTFEKIDTSKHYRLTGWVNMPTKWNDASKSYEPRSQEQIDAQRQIYELMKNMVQESRSVYMSAWMAWSRKTFP